MRNKLSPKGIIATSEERSDKPFAIITIRETGFLKFRLGQCSECDPAVWFEPLVAAILSTDGIRSLNPYLSQVHTKW